MRIAFVTGGFPALSETFILNQITGQIKLGNDVTVLPKYLIRGKHHNDISEFRNKYTIITPLKVPANALIRFLLMITLLPRCLVRNPLATIQAFNISRFGKKAVSCRLFYQAYPFIKVKYDILFVHYADYLGRALIIKKLKLTTPVLVMMHGSDLRKIINSGGENNFDFNLSGADKILSISEYTSGILVRSGYPREKIIRHNVGIDLSRFGIKNDIVRDKPILKILSVGRLTPVKGHCYGIRAIATYNKMPGVKRIEYVIAGEGPDLSELQKLVNDLDLTEVIRFSGAMTQEELAGEYANADILIHPSIEEVTPLVIMEAMASGIPIIATDTGAVSEIVNNNVTGFLVEPRNPEQIAVYLKKLTDDSEMRRKMGIEGRLHICKNYDISILNRRLEEIFKECLSESRLA